MIKIRVEYVLDRTVEDVFDAITDHENYKRFPGFDSSKLLETGKTEKNGEGALRLLVSGGVTFKERITCFERPSKMSYHCEEMKPLPIRHERGDITMEPIDGKTRVTWISESHLEIPIIGSLLGKLMQRRISRAFLGVLKHIEAN
jgi:uncharacterized protein YndB with AHSA1/START domain